MASTDQEAEVFFGETSKAFSQKTNGDLRFSHFIFKLIQYPSVVSVFSKAMVGSINIGLPVKGLVRATAFRQFCGGESIEKCMPTIEKLNKSGIGAILDYSVEAEQEEKAFDQTKSELLRIVQFAKGKKGVPVTCIKLTGVLRIDLLEKVSSKATLSSAESEEFARGKARLLEICNSCAENDVPIYIDAEESWIQQAIDDLAEEMMAKFNSKKAIVFTTLQMYRHDRFAYLQKLSSEAQSKSFICGVKIVRGAYMEKEGERAKKMGYSSPIQSSKVATDDDYNKAIEFIVDNINHFELCAGTHNEKSSYLLTKLMASKGLKNNDPRIYFSQLFGMSDHISFNLSQKGYLVSKYLPYGPVESTLPYLIRRAEENTSISGQMGKELRLIKEEIKRRKTTPPQR